MSGALKSSFFVVMKLCFVSSVLFAGALRAEGFVVPSLREPVQDQANLFSSRVRQEVSTFLNEVHEKGGPQIQVLTIQSLEGLPIEEASIKIVEAWQLGDKEKDNGVLLLIAKQERKLRIEVGQGIEGDLPDVVAKRIISRIVSPLFKSGRMDEGLKEAVAAILGYVAPQFLQGREGELIRDSDQGSSRGFDLWVFLLLIILISFQAMFRWRSHLNSGYRGSMGGWAGGGGFGGRSSSDWSGGGGGFSGGGASGDW